MQTREWKIADGGWQTRSVLECGGPPPLWSGRGQWSSGQSARGLAHSKTWRNFGAFCLLLCALCFRASAQSYSIDWHTIDGGGGTSTGGVYTVTGTIGQPDAGVMSGGPFTLTGGFWGIIAAVQTPGAPLLSVTRTATNTVVVSWPGPEAGWRLQSTASLSTTPVVWTPLPPPYPICDTHLCFIETAAAGNKFYRLQKP